MAKRPNLVFIMSDQQRYDTIGALGNPAVLVLFTSERAPPNNARVRQ